MMKLTVIASAIILSGGSGAGCGTSETPLQPPHKSQTGVIGAKGGTLDLDGFALSIPSGALSESQTIKVTALAEAVPAPYMAASGLYRLEPEGITFAAPVSVRMRFEGMKTGVTLFWSRPAGGFDDVGGEVSGDEISATNTHFSVVFVGRRADLDGAVPDAMPDRGDAGGADGGRDGAGTPDGARVVDAGRDAIRDRPADSRGSNDALGGRDAVVAGDASVALGLEVTPSSAQITVGWRQYYTAALYYKGGARHYVSNEAAWTSSDPGVAAMEMDPMLPMVNGVSAGQATITASYMGFTGSGTLNVTCCYDTAAATCIYDAVSCRLTAGCACSPAHCSTCGAAPRPDAGADR